MTFFGHCFPPTLHKNLKNYLRFREPVCFDILHHQSNAKQAWQITELLDIWLGSKLSLSSAFTRPHLGGFIPTDPPIVCNCRLSCTSHLTPDTPWPRRPFERDTLLSDRWMFFCCGVKTLVSSYSCLITPTGPENGWQRAFLTFL